MRRKKERTRKKKEASLRSSLMSMATRVHRRKLMHTCEHNKSNMAKTEKAVKAKTKETLAMATRKTVMAMRKRVKRIQNTSDSFLYSHTFT